MNQVQQLEGLIEEASRIVAFTGAGISTESGIPDFRSPGGVWTKYRPIDFGEFMASEEARRESWRRKIGSDRTIGQATPNRGHLALAELRRRGKLRAVITQNVDGLHQQSGIPENEVIELHGNATYAACLDCRQRYELEPIVAAFRERDELPICRRQKLDGGVCNGIVKTATISFGQAMPEAAMRRARQATLAADLFLAIGSSLVVYPAAGFPELARQAGARLVILNREATDLDGIADLVLHAEIGPTLGSITGVSGTDKREARR